MQPEERIAGTLDRLLTVLCVRLGGAERLADLCRAAARGGLRALELTLTTPGALDAIAELAREEDLLVGAGTVLTVDDVRRVQQAGARCPLIRPRGVSSPAPPLSAGRATRRRHRWQR